MRLFVVEDEKKLAISLKKILEAEHYTVDICHDGQEAYEQASVESYDLILLDLNLPTLDGTQVCQLLRNEGVKTPIIMVTARDALNDRVTGLDVGADDYVVKPYEFDELLARIRALLRRDSSQINEILAVDDLSLNPHTHLVTRSKKEISLSAREYALLEFLIRRSDQIVSKSDLLDHVWGSEVDSFSNVVDVYIGYLRKKIDKSFPHKTPLLHTLKGVGYRLGIVRKK